MTSSSTTCSSVGTTGALCGFTVSVPYSLPWERTFGRAPWSGATVSSGGAEAVLAGAASAKPAVSSGGAEAVLAGAGQAARAARHVRVGDDGDLHVGRTIAHRRRRPVRGR